MTSPQGPWPADTSTPQATHRPQPPAGSAQGDGAGTAPPAGLPPTPGAGGMLPGAFRSGRQPDGGTAERPSVQVASYRDYVDAQRAVDYLSDQGFPVQNTSIVGTGLHLVEQVLGRMTTGKAALSGAGGGAWLGLLIGLLLGLFSVGGWLAVVVTAVLIGAAWGAILGAIAHAALRGQRDFSSRSRLEASEYAVNVVPSYADDARHILLRLNWNP
jgi:hypothetical protein